MKELRREDKLFFFERNWFTLDGLWFLEIENDSNWEIALKIDTDVWIRLLKIIVRRIKRYLKIETNTIYDIIKILTFRWSCEGWDYEISKVNKNTINIEIHKCPYKEIMNRNPDRYDKTQLICKGICIPLYEQVVKDFNPEILLIRNKFQGLGDNICNFKLTFKNGVSKTKDNLLKQEITLEDRLFYFEKNWFTMDGLWMVETENKLGWERALKIDVIVWQRLYKIIFRRLKRYLNIEGNSIKDLIKILEFAWSCEGYDYEIVKIEKKEVILNITMCPYKAAMDRNPDRLNKIKAICIDMCIPFYEPALKDFNPKIKLERNKFLGVGDKVCNFRFRLEE